MLPLAGVRPTAGRCSSRDESEAWRECLRPRFSPCFSAGNCLVAVSPSAPPSTVTSEAVLDDEISADGAADDAADGDDREDADEQEDDDE